MMSQLDLTREQAVNAALRSQHLSQSSAPGSGSSAAAGIIEQLGYIQIDTISVVMRAHHHTLWTRMEDYSPRMLHRLQADDRKIFEYWGHAASYLPMSDYRYYACQMRRNRDPESKWAADRLRKCGHMMEEVLERVRREGPLGSKDFNSEPGVKRSQWWDWKPAKTALELLFWRGDLMIARRENFHRIYDLTERVLPSGTDTTVPNEDEVGRFMVRRALKAHGTATERSIADHIHAAGRKTVRNALAELADAGEVVPASVEGQAGYYAMAESAQQLSGEAPVNDGVHILSPFDNLIIDRGRVERLFGFRYALECYTPKDRREYGYFVLPVLWGNRFAARIDAKADRKSGALEVLSLHFEGLPGDTDAFIHPFVSKLADFAAFNGCSSIRLHRALPAKLLPPLRKGIDRMEQRRRDE